jgi:hypothetical protein
MSERKVLNKYYPPDFNPSLVQLPDKQENKYKVTHARMMLPFSANCYTCGNYMYIGTKLNMKVEAVADEDYLGILIHRFYFKCTKCYAQLTFKTDPKNHDYVAEKGCSRNNEMWKDMQMAEEEYKELKQSEMKEDAMKSLEHRTYDSKREMDILDSLDQVRNLNKRQSIINYDELINKAVKNKDAHLVLENEKKIEEEVREKFKKLKEKRIEDYNLNKDDLLNKKLKRTIENDHLSSDDELSNKEDTKKLISFNKPQIKLKTNNNKKASSMISLLSAYNDADD